MSNEARSDLRGRSGAGIAYRKLASELRSNILSNVYADGARLPTEAELVLQQGLSRQTIRRAFQELVAEGMVYRVPGRGTFAATGGTEYLRHFGSIEDLMALSQDTTFELLTPLARRVDVTAASRLRLPTDVVHSVTFRRLHENVPFCVTSVFVPPAIGARLAASPDLSEQGKTSTVTIIGLIDAQLDERIAEAEQSVTVASLPPDMAAFLGCTDDHPLLRIDRLYYDAKGDPVELAISHFLPERYSYRVRLRRTARGGQPTHGASD